MRSRSLFSSIVANTHLHYSDEEYEWEYIESDEENNQKAKADENKATVSLPTKVHCHISNFSNPIC